MSALCALQLSISEFLPSADSEQSFYSLTAHVRGKIIWRLGSGRFCPRLGHSGCCGGAAGGGVLRLQPLCSHPESVSSISSLWEFVVSGRGPGPGGACAFRSSWLQPTAFERLTKRQKEILGLMLSSTTSVVIGACRQTSLPSSTTSVAIGACRQNKLCTWLITLHHDGKLLQSTLTNSSFPDGFAGALLEEVALVDRRNFSDVMIGRLQHSVARHHAVRLYVTVAGGYA